MRLTRASAVATVCMAVLSVIAMPVVHADTFGDRITPKDKAILLHPSELPAQNRHPLQVMSLNWGSDTAPTGCVRLDNGKSLGDVAPRAIYRDINVNGKLSWQNAVYEYATPEAAQASFDKLRQNSAAACNSSFRVNQTGDGDRTPVNVTTASHDGVAVDGRPHFVVQSGEVLANPAHAPKLAHSLYGLHDFVLSGTGIIDVTIWQQKPISAKQRSQAAALADAVAARYAASS